jgi:osmotically-inducible protein OsmY
MHVHDKRGLIIPKIPNVSVQTFDSIVYLYGQVDAGFEKRNAADIAQQVAGVTTL